jgi:hypothetical protein
MVDRPSTTMYEDAVVLRLQSFDGLHQLLNETRFAEVVATDLD